MPLVTVCDTAPIEGGREWEPTINIGDAKSERHDLADKHSNVSSGCSLPHVQPEPGNGGQPQTRSSITAPAASHSLDQPELKLLNLHSSQAKGNTDSDDDVIVEDSRSMGDQDRDSILGVSEDDTNQDDDKSNSESDSWESIIDSGPKSVTGEDCPTCSDTEDVAVKSVHKKLYKKIHASCSPAKQGLWKDAQL